MKLKDLIKLPKDKDISCYKHLGVMSEFYRGRNTMLREIGEIELMVDIKEILLLLRDAVWVKLSDGSIYFVNIEDVTQSITDNIKQIIKVMKVENGKVV